MKKYTPGPWKIVQHTGREGKMGSNDDWTITGPRGEAICFEGQPLKAANANASLLVAAPDMYEALKASLRVMEQFSESKNVAAAKTLARNALAKADGADHNG